MYHQQGSDARENSGHGNSGLPRNLQFQLLQAAAKWYYRTALPLRILMDGGSCPGDHQQMPS